MKEKNIENFNEDVKTKGRYLYTDINNYSAMVATKRQTDELVKFIRKYIKKDKRILDVGCGDGTFTIALSTKVCPSEIVGFDCAKLAIKFAKSQLNSNINKGIKFQQGNIYDAHKIFEDNFFDLIIVRGVLHHLYDPKKGIKSISRISNKIIVLEPNGYNPFLKIIEKVSPYHRAHEEKSYWPPTLNEWFLKNGFKVRQQKFFSIVPYFAPKLIVDMLQSIERFAETLPLVNKFYCGTNLVLYEKK